VTPHEQRLKRLRKAWPSIADKAFDSNLDASWSVLISPDWRASDGVRIPIVLRILLVQEIWDEPLKKTSDETDDQHHLPGQAAAAEVGVADLEGREDAASQEQQ
jgi:hypothetical protein